MRIGGPRLRTAPRAVLVTIAFALIAAAIAAPASATVPADAVRSTYDDAGRLRSVIGTDATGGARAPREAAVFEWDAVGNLLSIDRFLASDLSVIGVTPGSGKVGDTVAIAGTGFGDVPRDLVVRFAGTSATIVDAADEQLHVTVPFGAASGRIAVTRGLSSATSAESFNVQSDQAPHISGISPTIVRAGDQITVSGDHFSAAKGENDVRLNVARGRVVSARASEVVVEAPAIGSGRVTVETPDGSAAGPDAFVVPPAYATTDVVDSGRLILGSARSLTFAAAGKLALLVVDARENDVIRNLLASSTMSGYVSIWSPTGTLLSEYAFSTGSTTHPGIRLPADGTYTVLVRSTSAGSVTLTSFVDVVEPIVPTASGVTRTVRTSISGQQARLRFDGRAGQRIAVAVTGNTLSGWIEIAGAGTMSYTGTYTNLANGYLDVITLPSDGEWDVWLETYGSPGQATVTVYDVPADQREDVTLTSSVLSRDLRFDSPGQNAVFNFTGRAGERVSARFPTIGLSAFTTRVVDSRGNWYGSASWTSSSRGFMEATLPADGAYSLVVDPTGADTGTATMEAFDASDVVESITPTASGVTRTLRTTYSGQDARMRFTGRAGQRIAVGVTDSTLTGWIEIARAGTQSLTGTYTNLANGYLDIITIPSDGEWDAWIETSQSGGGEATVTVYDVPADMSEDVTLSSSVLRRDLRFENPGQNAVFNFTGRAGQRVGVRFPTIGLSAFTTRVVDSRGNWYGSASWTSSSSGFMEATLPADGTYSVVVDPSGANTGTATMEAFDASDVVESITPTASGVTRTLRTAYSGQDARMRFTGRAGQRIAVGVTGSTLTGWIEIARAGTASTTGTYVNLSSGYLDVITLPSDGEWDAWIETSQSGGGEATMSVYDVPADMREDVTLTSSVLRRDLRFDSPGQNAVFNFTGRAGERVGVRFPTIGLSAFTTRVVDSRGSWYGSASWTSSSRGFMEATLPADGTYSVVVDPTGADTGTATMEAFDASDVVESITPSASGETRTVTTTYAGQDVRLRFTARAGQRIALGISRSTLSGWMAVSRAGTMGYVSGYTSLATGWFEPVTVPSDGSYDAWIETSGSTGGEADLTVYDVPADQRDTVTLSSTALRSDVRIDYPGQRAQLLFDGRTSQTLSTSLSSSTLSNASIYYYRPDGGWLNGWSFGTSAARQSGTLNATGTHMIQIDPQGALTGSVSVLAMLTDDGRVLARSGGVVEESADTDDPLAPATTAPVSPPVPAPADLDPDPATGGTRASDGQLSTPLPSGPPAGGTPARAHEPAAARRSVDQRATSVVRRRPAARRSAKRRARSRSAARRGAKRHATAHARAAHARAAHRHARPRAASGPATSRPAAPSGGQLGAIGSAGTPAEQRFVRSLSRWRSPAAPAWRPTRADRRGPWAAGELQSPWARLAPLAPGTARTTALSGQVLRVDGTPLRGVDVFVEGSRRTTSTDRTGRFLLRGLQSGRHVLVVDGREVGAHGYGIYEMRVDLDAGETTVLPYTVWLTGLDRAGDARIPVPTRRETVLTNARIPGLEVHIPAGSRITDADGHLVRDLNLTALPVDRPPFPLPEGVQVPAYFTAQPGRAYLSKGARIVYPNYHHLAPGQRVAFWNYDADDRGWYIYGYGEVTANAQQVVPDPGVRIWEFTGAMASTGAPPPGFGPGAGGGFGGGDPVDLGTGLFVYEKTDLALPDAIPAVAKRTYRPADSNIYTFGRGTTSSYDLRLYSVTAYSVAQLVLPDGGTVRYERTSPGTDWQTAVYEARTTPGPWFGSVIRRTADMSGWEMQRRDGAWYEFDSGFGPVTAIRDRDGNLLTISRSSGNYGNALQVTTPHGRWLRFTYDRYNRATEVVDNTGRRVGYTYDADSRLETVTDADGGVTTLTYDRASQMTEIEDARGTTFLRNRYDGNGRVVEQTLGDGGVYRFAYTLDGGGRTVVRAAVTDPRGAVQEVAFDAAGLPVSDTRAVGTADEQVTRFERNARTNLVEAVVDPLGDRTELTYGADANVTEVTRLAGTGDAVTTRWTYGADSRLLTRTDPRGKVTRWDYDGQGRLTSITDATSRATTLGYNGASRLPAWIRDAAGNQTYLTHVDGELNEIRDPLGRVTRRWVDSLGRVTAVTDPLGRTTRAAFSDGNLLTRQVDPRGGTTTFDHDENGNLTTVTDARGKTTRATWDVLNRLLSWTDGNDEAETVERDLNGNVVKLTDREGQVTTLGYDELNRRTFAGFGTTGSPGRETYDDTIEYDWDDADRLVELDDSQAGTIEQEFDGLDRLAGQTTPNGEVEYGYDDAGRRETLSLDGSSLAAYGHDDAGRLTSVVQGGGTTALGYDAAGRLDTVELPNGVVRDATYDTASQVTRLAFEHDRTSLGELDYDYDKAGRRAATWGSLAATRLPEELRSATYDDANRLTERDRTTLRWDLNGNLVDDGTQTYEWNSRNQLAAIRDGGGTVASFAYDPFGRRSAWEIGGDERSFVYDGWNVVGEDGDGGEATVVNGLGLDQRFARTLDGTTRTLLTDALGSTVALTDDDGEITDQFAYGPFGESDAAGPEQPYQYTGRENDGTGLLQYRNRYYSPELKRFVSEDPIGMAGSGPNSYGYVGGDPLGYTDPLGTYGIPLPSSWPRLDPGRAVDVIGDSLAPATGYTSLGAEGGAIGGFGVSVNVSCHGNWSLGVTGGFGLGGSGSITHHTGTPRNGALEIVGGGTAGGVSGSGSVDVGNGSGGVGVGAGIGASASIGVGTTIGPKDGGC